MRKLLSLTAAAALLATVPLSAQAFPIGGTAPTSGESAVTLVAGGCGVGFHRGPLGGCRPNVGVRRSRIVCRVVGIIPHRVCNRVFF